MFGILDDIADCGQAIVRCICCCFFILICGGPILIIVGIVLLASSNTRTGQLSEFNPIARGWASSPANTGLDDSIFRVLYTDDGSSYLQLNLKTAPGRPSGSDITPFTDKYFSASTIVVGSFLPSLTIRATAQNGRNASRQLGASIPLLSNRQSNVPCQRRARMAATALDEQKSNRTAMSTMSTTRTRGCSTYEGGTTCRDMYGVPCQCTSCSGSTCWCSYVLSLNKVCVQFDWDSSTSSWVAGSASSGCLYPFLEPVIYGPPSGPIEFMVRSSDDPVINLESLTHGDGLSTLTAGAQRGSGAVLLAIGLIPVLAIVITCVICCFCVDARNKSRGIWHKALGRSPPPAQVVDPAPVPIVVNTKWEAGTDSAYGPQAGGYVYGHPQQGGFGNPQGGMMSGPPQQGWIPSQQNFDGPPQQGAVWNPTPGEYAPTPGYAPNSGYGGSSQASGSGYGGPNSTGYPQGSGYGGPPPLGGGGYSPQAGGSGYGSPQGESGYGYTPK